ENVVMIGKIVVLGAFFGNKVTRRKDVEKAAHEDGHKSPLAPKHSYPQQQQGNISLRLKADAVPVKVKFGKLKTMKITFRVRCDLVVDKLAANISVNISTKKCKIHKNRDGHGHGEDGAEACVASGVTCDPIALSPCASAMFGPGNPKPNPTPDCYKKLKLQQSCMCKYAKEKNLSR
ncbi:hypothetical protein KI387_034277, partial [Taxus chinensis]